MEQQKKRFAVSSAPHIRAKDSTASLMLDVLTALTPCVVAGIWRFGWGAARVLLVSVISCVVMEYLFQKLTKRKVRINDLSAAVTGLILGLNLPPTAPWWLVIVGSAVAILLVKQLFGGIGDNFVNPALAARGVLLASWPALMAGHAFTLDGVSTATPLSGGALIGDGVSQATSLTSEPMPIFSEMDLLVGRIPGSIGEVCKIAILLGLVYLLLRKTITWHIPVTMIASFMLFTWLFGGNPFTGVLMGSVLFGAVFMATDYVTSPVTHPGQIVYAAGAGLLIALIRAFGGYPEGTTYAILLMNIASPLIDRATSRRIYGEVKKA